MLNLCKISFTWTPSLAKEWLMAYNNLVLANSQLDWITSQDKEVLNCVKQAAELYLTINNAIIK